MTGTATAYSKEAVLQSLNIPELIQSLLPAGKQRGDEWGASCPFHEENNPSFGVNLATGKYNCFGCGEQGDIFGLYGHFNSLSYSESVNALGEYSSCQPGQNGNYQGKSKEEPKKKPVPPIPNSVVEDLADKMTQKAYQWLTKHRSISEEVSKMYEIGLREKYGQKRFSIPTRNEQDRVMNIRLWLPPEGKYKDPEERRKAGKMKSWTDGIEGRGQARLFPLDQLTASFLVLCEGELDALALISSGIPAITVTGGAGTWKEEWPALFKGKVVTIAYDNDEAGGKGAKKVAESLVKAGVTVKVLSWPKDRAKGWDVTDEILLRGVESMRKLLDNSIRFYKTCIENETNFNPISASIILSMPDEKIPWIWDKMIPRGSLFLLSAFMKVGKSELAYRLAVAIARGESFLDMPTIKTGVLILAVEEHQRDVRIRLKRLGIRDKDPLFVNTGRLQNSGDTISCLNEFIQNKGIGLILIDTISRFWNVREENNNQEIIREVSPLLDLAHRTDTAIGLLHHDRKGGGENGENIRGGSALFGLVDQALMLSRRPGGAQNQRALKTLGRYSESPPELLIELNDDDQYRVLGTSEEVKKEAALVKVFESLTEEPLDVETLAKESGLTQRETRNILNALYEEGQVLRDGRGVKNDKHKYRLPDKEKTAETPENSFHSQYMSIRNETNNSLFDENEKEVVVWDLL